MVCTGLIWAKASDTLSLGRFGGLDLKQEELFYHGSIIRGLDTILANAKSHIDGSKVA